MKFAFVHKIKLIFQEPFCGFFNKVFLSCSRKSFFVLKFSDGSLFLSLSETETFLAEPTPYFRFIRYIRFFNWSRFFSLNDFFNLWASRFSCDGAGVVIRFLFVGETSTNRSLRFSFGPIRPAGIPMNVPASSSCNVASTDNDLPLLLPLQSRKNPNSQSSLVLQYPNSEQQGLWAGQPRLHSTLEALKGGAAQLWRPVPAPSSPRHSPTREVQPDMACWVSGKTSFMMTEDMLGWRGISVLWPLNVFVSNFVVFLLNFLDIFGWRGINSVLWPLNVFVSITS